MTAYFDSYQGYLAKRRSIDRLTAVMRAIDDYGVEDVSNGE